ncbi:TIGR02587 family membrane protein [Rhizobium sp. 32-5/1]|uniref:TIGR02587 family membrane protein n=1 Tax=Rhizobium sp. 32-5/1 TaxID=3019602 RepID=UPI00240D552E|nr:TIGR02587 family membrane protein [Rhizobium sp. 32-5/1]WEZ84317.1 TIGR02587 family membrane protein [Rhizobium sp. 32-5/1]
MSTDGAQTPSEQGSEDLNPRDQQTEFVVGLGRGIGGALLFALPMQMTMEMWQLGFYIDRSRLFLLLIVAIPLLIGIAHRIGFEKTIGWKDDIRDSIIAYGIGIVTSIVLLSLFRILTPDMPASEIIGKIALQAVPASIGAMLGRSQLGNGGADDDDEDSDGAAPDDKGYGSELFLMAVGALYLNLNMAPTEEMILISYKMTPWHALATILLSITLMHGFVYAVSFKGGHEISGDTPGWHALIRFTLPGYIIALAISLYALWTFGRLDGVGLTPSIMAMIVLGFPGALGAAAARLIL